LLAHVRGFSPCTLASSTTKTGRHDIVEILLKVALNTKNQSNQHNITLRCHNKENNNFTSLMKNRTENDQILSDKKAHEYKVST
jgi:hypothetical protein